MGFIRKPMGEGLVCDRIAGQKVKSVIGPPGPPMTLGKLRREKGGSKRKSLGALACLLDEAPGTCGRGPRSRL
jgi:hypothetical protein